MARMVTLQDVEQSGSSKTVCIMPGGPNLDSPGTLHHAIVREIEKKRS
jgi:hypothetical protein